MLRMLSSCQLCRTPLPSDGEAWICSYECTYCPACAAALDACPNCAGEVVPRPRRTTGVTTVAARLPARLVHRLRGVRGA